MLQEFSINKCSRKCKSDGKPLEPGESYYSVIIPEGDDLSRIDIAARNWSEPPENAVGWWKCKMPAAGAKKLKPAPNGVLLDTLAELIDMPGKEKLSYLLALLLVRRQVLIEEASVFGATVGSDHASTTEVDAADVADEDSSKESSAEDGADEISAPTWTLTCKADGRAWDVVVVEPTASEMVELENELNALLFTEQ